MTARDGKLTGGTATRLAGNEWLQSRWAGITNQQKLVCTAKRVPSLRDLHRESGSLGVSRLGQRAVDRLATLMRMPTSTDTPVGPLSANQMWGGGTGGVPVPPLFSF